MVIEEVTRQSQWQRIADVTTCMIEQMKSIGKNSDPTRVKLAMDNALKPGSSARFFICYDDDTPAGCCFLNIGCGIEAGGDYIWINEIHVRREYRKKGVGTTLLNHILQWAKEQGYGYIASMTGPSNIACHELFTHFEFKTAECVWMEKLL